MNNYYISIFIIFTLFINAIFAQNEDYFAQDNELNKDRHYLVFINNKYGEVQLYNKSKNQKRQEGQAFVESLLDEINSLIINNKDTYENPEKLNEMENATQMKKRNENGTQISVLNFQNSELVFPISSVNDRLVLLAYLSEPLAMKIKSLENVIDCIPNGLTSIQHYYNEQDILTETNWKGLTVRENADFHLSLISQGIFDRTQANKYDTNYYYPESAGKDIDIVVIDSSFHFEYSEFANTDDRIVKCAVNVEYGKAYTDEIDDFCGFSGYYHGEVVADVAAGLKHGVASRANVYGVSIPTNHSHNMKNSDVLVGLQFVYENMIRPHKTVINLSLATYHEETSEYYQQFKSIIDGITEKGGIIVAAAGNDGREMGKDTLKAIPCELDNVICVGGINDNKEMNKKDDLVVISPGDNQEELDVDFEKVYSVDKGSNYGSSVDFYAPYYVEAEVLKIDRVIKIKEKGTSFSSPIAAGIIATIMGEHPEIEFTKDTMTSFIFENGKSELFKNGNESAILINNGKHIVYSKDGVYHGCGIRAGNTPCAPETQEANTPTTITTNTEVEADAEAAVEPQMMMMMMESQKCGPNYGSCSKPTECCSQFGYCGETIDYCGVGCQPSYGLCY